MVCVSELNTFVPQAPTRGNLIATQDAVFSSPPYHDIRYFISHFFEQGATNQSCAVLATIWHIRVPIYWFYHYMLWGFNENLRVALNCDLYLLTLITHGLLRYDDNIFETPSSAFSYVYINYLILNYYKKKLYSLYLNSPQVLHSGYLDSIDILYYTPRH